MKNRTEIQTILDGRDAEGLSNADMSELVRLVEEALVAELTEPAKLPPMQPADEETLFRAFVRSGWSDTDHADYMLHSMNLGEQRAMRKAVLAVFALGFAARELPKFGGPRRFRVIETDNFGGDYPDESWQSPELTEEAATAVAAFYNRERCNHSNAPRFYRVVPADYKLKPGFEP